MEERLGTLETEFAEHRADVRTLFNAVKDLKDTVDDLRRTLASSSRTPWLVIFGIVTIVGGFAAWNLSIVTGSIVSHVEENAAAAMRNDDAIRNMQANRWTNEMERESARVIQEELMKLHDEISEHALLPSHSGTAAALSALRERVERLERVLDR